MTRKGSLNAHALAMYALYLNKGSDTAPMSEKHFKRYVNEYQEERHYEEILFYLAYHYAVWNRPNLARQKLQELKRINANAHFIQLIDQALQSKPK